jgi:hypothetical protein
MFALKSHAICMTRKFERKRKIKAPIITIRSITSRKATKGKMNLITRTGNKALDMPKIVIRFHPNRSTSNAAVFLIRVVADAGVVAVAIVLTMVDSRTKSIAVRLMR